MSTATPVLIADIGGTNARFALTDIDAPTPTVAQIRKLPTADYASLQHAIEAYLAEVGVQPTAAALAVASPVDGDEIRLTNRAWAFSRSELQAALGLQRLTVINDFGAIARAVPWLHPQDMVTLHGEPTAPMRGPISVLGPGTGLGVALLVGDEADGWDVVETEGGHVTFAPLGDEEHAIVRHLTALHGRVSTERVLSGRGLAHIDAVLRGAGNVLRAGGGALLPGDSSLQPVELRDPAEIVAAALDGHDVAARRALARFCAVLGSVTGDITLLHGAHTVVLAGGIVPRFIPFLRSSAFRERLLAKGRFATWFDKVTIHVITHPDPGLLGSAVAARGARQRNAT